MLTKYDYEKLAEEISDDFMENKTPLNDSIKVTAIKMELNPEQIKRLTESTNIKTYNKMFDEKEDKTFDFELGDSKKVISDVYDKETEIKDMPPVEYKPDNNPKKPEHSYEVLGDDDELDVSKNTMNSEDSSSDSFEEALKIPKKDYSYSTTDSTDVAEKEDEKEDEDVVIPEEQEDDEEEDEKLKKTASLTKLSQVKKELDNRVLLLSDKLVDQTNMAASLFVSSDKHEKFGGFFKAAHALYSDHPHFKDAIDLVKDHAFIDIKKCPDITPVKYASENSYGVPSFKKLLGTLETYTKTARAKNLLDSELK